MDTFLQLKSGAKLLLLRALSCPCPANEAPAVKPPPTKSFGRTREGGGRGAKNPETCEYQAKESTSRKTFVIGAIIIPRPSDFLNVLVMILNLHFKQLGELKADLV